MKLKEEVFYIGKDGSFTIPSELLELMNWEEDTPVFLGFSIFGNESSIKIINAVTKCVRCGEYDIAFGNSEERVCINCLKKLNNEFLKKSEEIEKNKFL